LNIARASRVAAAVMAVIVGLVAAKAVAGYVTGSVALQADALHSSADVLTVFAAWFGLSFARKKPSERFPYGYFRVETLAALVGAGIVTVLGLLLFVEGIARIRQPVEIAHPFPAMAVASLSAAVSWLIAGWQGKAAALANSQSLKVSSQELKIDIGSSLLVFVAIGCGALNLPVVDGAAALLIAGAVMFVGVKNIWIAVLSLMDASLDPEMESEIVSLVAGIEGIQNVETVRVRRAGPCYFVDGHIRVLPSIDVARGHEIAHKAVRAVRERFKEVEGVTFHVEPYRPSRRRVVMPVEDDAGLESRISDHFGRSACFVIAEVDGPKVMSVKGMSNPFAGKKVRAALSAVKDLVEREKIDAVVLREVGEIAFHALRDKLVEIYRTDEQRVGPALERLAAGELDLLERPTHSSDEGKKEERG